MRLSTLLVLVCVAVLMTGASAQRSLECQKVWDGPSSNNDLVDCLKNSDRISSQWRYYVFPGVAALVFLICAVVIPLCILCSCCSCCRCCACCLCLCRPPKSVKSRRKGTAWLWMWVFFAVLWSCAAGIMIIYGAALLMSSVTGLLDGFESGPLNYMNDTKTLIVNLLVDYTKDPPQPVDVDTSAFDDVEREIRQHVHDTRSEFYGYFEAGRTVSCVIGALGLVLMFIVFIVMVCRITVIVNLVLTIVYATFAIFYSLFAVLFAVSIYFLSAFCGEVTLHYEREPGVFQWLVVPWCENQFDFEDLRTEVNNAVVTASETACQGILEICDDSLTYHNDEKIFMCGLGITAKEQCTNFDYLASVVENTYAKPILNNMLCTNTNGWEYQENCTVYECSSRCPDYSLLKAKSLSWGVMMGAKYAQNASTALSYVMPMMQCDFIVDKIVSTLETTSQLNSAYSFHWPKQSNCSNLRLGSILLGAGFFVGALTFSFGVYILLRARSLWGNSIPESSEKDTRYTETE